MDNRYNEKYHEAKPSNKIISVIGGRSEGSRVIEICLVFCGFAL